MKVIWNQNPLLSYIQIDAYDREKMSVSMSLILLADAVNVYTESKTDEAYDAMVKSVNYIPSSSDMKEVESHLMEHHAGDCVGYNSCCVKCFYETIIGFSTIAHASPEVLQLIAIKYEEFKTINAVLKSLKNDKEEMTGFSIASNLFCDAILWLEEYKDFHNF